MRVLKIFRHLQSQTEEIFFSAALEREGGYLFQVAEETAPAPTLLAHIPAQQLLFHAAERLDRMREFQLDVNDFNDLRCAPPCDKERHRK